MEDDGELVSIRLSDVQPERLPYAPDEQIALLEKNVDWLRAVRNGSDTRGRARLNEVIRDLRAVILAIKHPEVKSAKPRRP